MAIARGVSGIGLPVALPIALALMFFADGLRMMPERRIGKSLLLETVLLAASLVPICLAGYGAEGPRYIVTYWAALATFVPCWQYADTVLEVNPYRRVAEFLGDISYSVYLLGTPLTWLAAGTVWTATGNRTATVVALVGTTVLLSWSVYQWIEAPCIRFGKRLDRRRLTYAKSVPAAVLD
jgi:peptidoglycan/LPS O-acetylase OafA/YrhL